MEWVLFVHVLLGTLWLGGVMYVEALVAGARQGGRDSYVSTWVATAKTSGRIYPVVTMALLATAVWMIVAGDNLDWGDTWISISLGLWVVSVGIGIAYFAPTAKKMEAQLAEEGPTDSLHAAIERVHMIARADIILILGLLFLMIFKPGS